MSFQKYLVCLTLLALLLSEAGTDGADVKHHPLRLADSWKLGTGRVEIWDHAYNAWKVICDLDWDLDDSNVVCHQLGYPGASRWYPSHANKKNDFEFFNGLGQCHGNETFLDDCLSSSHPCSHFRDAIVAVECEAPVRLVDGQRGNEGRVEIYRDGSWATVCVENLDLHTANVLCEYMDFMSAFEVVQQSASQGNGSLLSVSCEGTKSWKESCTTKPNDCSHKWAAGLVCQWHPEAAVRLIEATSPREGIIIIHRNGSWGAVCNDIDQFNLIDASVVCRQLGYSSAINVDVENGVRFADQALLVPEYFFYDLECTGAESNLMECRHLGTPSNCLPNQPAGVKCSEHDVTQSGIELVKGNSSDPNGTGMLLLKYRASGSDNQTAKPVCFNGWDMADAQVACRQMGYKLATSTHSITGYGKYYSREQNAWFDRLQCTGIENALYRCQHGRWGDYSCYFSGFVAISCSNEHPPINVALSGGRRSGEGLLQVEYQGVMGAVCGDGWSMNAATVACRQLGFTAALRTSSGEEFGGRPSAMWMSNVNCNGSEETLQDCTHSGFHDFSKSCMHPIGVGVVCGDPSSLSPFSDMSVRLLGKVEERVAVGRVEIFHRGQWLGLCMDSLGRREAQAICRSLNYAVSYVDGIPVRDSAQFFGLGYSSSWIVELGCSTSEVSSEGLAACSTIGWSPWACRSAQPGVLCSAEQLTVQSIKWRLSGGRRKGEGIVEVGIADTWGTVCIDHWEMHAAKLLCKSLGYQTALASVKNVPSRSKFAVRDRLHFVNQVRCSGREKEISECDIVWEIGQCQGEKDSYAGVVCSDADLSKLPVRLVAGRNKYEGNVQLQYEGEWGYVCGNVWNITAADVVCKQLNSTGAARVKTFPDLSVCRVWLDQVQCRGDEPSIWDCSHNGLGIFHGTCSVSEYAGVVCKEADKVQIDRSAPTDHIELACNLLNHYLIGAPDHGLMMRLMSFGEDTTTTGRGRVEVFARRAWGTICDDGWDMLAANVTCKALGFEGVERIAEVEEFGKGEGHIWLDDITCTGQEISLDFCTKHGFGRSDCTHDEDAGVVCITEKLTSASTAEGSIDSITIAVTSTMAALVTVLAVTVLAMCLRRRKQPKKSSILEPVMQDMSSLEIQDGSGTEQESDVTMEASQCA